MTAAELHNSEDERLTAKELGRELISAFVVCFNEEDQIAGCLESLSFCDQLIVIDSFSTDRTVEICETHGAQVIQRKWPGYREQKAFGLASVRHEWVLNLDADERVSEELRENILKVLREGYQRKDQGKPNQGEQINGYAINRVVHYLGRWWRRGGWYPEWRVRFFRGAQVTWGGIDPHEKPIVQGRVEKIEGEIYHFTYKNLAEQFERLHSFSGISAEQDYQRGRRVTVWQLIFNPFLRSFKFLILKKGYREGVAGFIVSVIEGYYTFMKYAKLWEHELNDSLSGKDAPTEQDRK